jgi:hypothetical protein
MLYYSPEAMGQIKQIIRDKIAYIVPGVYCKEDTILGIKFNVPILSGNPECLEKYKFKSNIRQLFEKCNLPVAPGATKIKTEEDLYK